VAAVHANTKMRLEQDAFGSAGASMTPLGGYVKSLNARRQLEELVEKDQQEKE